MQVRHRKQYFLKLPRWFLGEGSLEVTSLAIGSMGAMIAEVYWDISLLVLRDTVVPFNSIGYMQKCLMI